MSYLDKEDFDEIKKAVFYAHEKPEKLAEILDMIIEMISEEDEDDVVTSLSISGADSIEIPTGDTANTADYTSKAFNQNGEEMTGQTITLALKASVTGVSISNGTVSVAKTATAESFTIKATCGTVTAEKTVALTAAE